MLAENAESIWFSTSCPSKMITSDRCRRPRCTMPPASRMASTDAALARRVAGNGGAQVVVQHSPPIFVAQVSRRAVPAMAEIVSARARPPSARRPGAWPMPSTVHCSSILPAVRLSRPCSPGRRSTRCWVRHSSRNLARTARSRAGRRAMGRRGSVRRRVHVLASEQPRAIAGMLTASAASRRANRPGSGRQADRMTGAQDRGDQRRARGTVGRWRSRRSTDRRRPGAASRSASAAAAVERRRSGRAPLDRRAGPGGDPRRSAPPPTRPMLTVVPRKPTRLSC